MLTPDFLTPDHVFARALAEALKDYLFTDIKMQRNFITATKDRRIVDFEFDTYRSFTVAIEGREGYFTFTLKDLMKDGLGAILETLGII